MKLVLALILVTLASPVMASKVTDHHELISLGNGVYQKNFNTGNDWRGFVTGDNSVLNRKWYVKYKVSYSSGWRWGSSTSGQSGQNLSNCKVFRMWNPSDSVKENFVIALMGWENNAMASMEYIGEQNKRFLTGFKNILKPGTSHVWEFEYVDSDVNQSNGYCKVWLNGNLVLDWQGIMTRQASSALKRPYNGGGIENVWPSSDSGGANTLTLSEVVMAEGKTRAEYLGTSPTPTPTPTPTVTPTPTPTPSLPTISGTATPLPTISGTANETPGWFIDFINKLITFLRSLFTL